MTDKQIQQLWNYLAGNKKLGLSTYQQRLIFDYVSRMFKGTEEDK